MPRRAYGVSQKSTQEMLRDSTNLVWVFRASNISLVKLRLGYWFLLAKVTGQYRN
jgi:hypothetical protein